MGTHASITASTTTPRSAAIRDYRYFEYTTPPNQTPITEVNSDPQLQRLVISIKKKNASPSSEQTSQGVLGSVIQWILGKPQKPTPRKNSISESSGPRKSASSSSMNGVKQVATASSKKSGVSSTTKGIPTSASRAPLQENDHEIIFLTAPNSWYGKFISWIFGSYKDIAEELRKEFGQDIINNATYNKICKEGITVAELKQLYTQKGSDDTATLSGETDDNGDIASIASYRSGSISSMTSTESLSSPVTSSASLSSDSSDVTPPSAPLSTPPSRSRSSSISSATGLSDESIPPSATAIRKYTGEKASMEVLQFPETILPDQPEDNIVANNGHHKDPTGAALMRFDTFAPVASNTNPAPYSPNEENKDNSRLSEQGALLSALNNVITTADSSAPVRFNSLEDLNKFYQERIQALKSLTKNQENRANATNPYFSEEVLNHITTIIAEKGYELVVNKESGKFEVTVQRSGQVE